MTVSTQKQAGTSKKLDEMILAVKRNLLFVDGAWQGLRTTNFDVYQNRILNHQEFHLRSLMEDDESFKQIIPYLIFKHNNALFVMQRSAQASEVRLQNQYTLGIGGHVRQEDLQKAGSVFDWARREFHEEVNYAGNLTITPLGILNDDSNAVGRVHVGLVLLLEGDSAEITVKSELKSGVLVPINECVQFHSQMESWSQLVFNVIGKSGLTL